MVHRGDAAAPATPYNARMSSPETFEIPLDTAELYEAKFVPALFADWAPHVVDMGDVTAGQSVLDVACGTGIVARTAAARVAPEGRVVGVDLNPAMLAEATSPTCPSSREPSTPRCARWRSCSSRTGSGRSARWAGWSKPTARSWSWCRAASTPSPPTGCWWNWRPGTPGQRRWRCSAPIGSAAIWTSSVGRVRSAGLEVLSTRTRM